MQKKKKHKALKHKLTKLLFAGQAEFRQLKEEPQESEKHIKCIA